VGGLASLIAGLASGELFVAIRRLRGTALTYALAALFVLLGIVYLLIAGTVWGARRYGLIETTLVIGVMFLAVAILILLYHRVTASARAQLERRRRKRDVTRAAIAASVAAMPTLAKGKTGLGLMLVPAAFGIAYAVYRLMRSDEDDADEDE